MSGRTTGAVILAAGVVEWFGRETIKTVFFDRVIHAMSPNIVALIEYGLPLGLSGLGIFLLWKSSIPELQRTKRYMLSIAVMIFGAVLLGAGAFMYRAETGHFPLIGANEEGHKAESKPNTASTPTTATVSEPATGVANKAMAASEPGLPQSLHELFKTDFDRTMRMHSELTLTGSDGAADKVELQVYYDMDAGTYFIGFFVPRTPRAVNLVQYLADGYLGPSMQVRQGLEVTSRDPADITSKKFSEFSFSRRIYVYHEDEFSIQDIASLDTLYRAKNLNLQLRGHQYATTRWLQKSSAKK
jgi:hypothetical protein